MGHDPNYRQWNSWDIVSVRPSARSRATRNGDLLMLETLLKSFDVPDEVREFPFGRFEIVHMGDVALGRATYQPGWKWSLHNAPISGTRLCHAPHTGTVLSGHGAVQYEDGAYLDLLPGTAFYITTSPHDSWVVGDVPYVSLHVLKAHSH